jgi:hypothetical protein
MMLRSGKQFFLPENQPFKLILLPEKTPYPNYIDFDKGFKEWRRNKIPLGGGLFEYKKPRWNLRNKK